MRGRVSAGHICACAAQTHGGSAVSRTRDLAVEDVSGGRDPVGCQNQPAKGVQENQRYVDFEFNSTIMAVKCKIYWQNLKKK